MQDACVVVPEGSGRGSRRRLQARVLPAASGSPRCRTTRRLTGSRTVTALAWTQRWCWHVFQCQLRRRRGGYECEREQMVNGQPIGASWNVSWVGDQVSSVYGAMAPLVSLGELRRRQPDRWCTLGDPRSAQRGVAAIAPMASPRRGRDAECVLRGRCTAQRIRSQPDVGVVAGPTVGPGSSSGSGSSDGAVTNPTPPPTVHAGSTRMAGPAGDHHRWQPTLVSYTSRAVCLLLHQRILRCPTTGADGAGGDR